MEAAVTTTYDPETRRVLLRAYDEAWIDIQGMLGAAPLDAAPGGPNWPNASWRRPTRVSVIPGV